MGDRAAKGTGLGPLNIDVYPLVVAGGSSEGVHLFLGDGVPLAVAEVVALLSLQFVNAVQGDCHERQRYAVRVPGAPAGDRSFEPDAAVLAALGMQEGGDDEDGKDEV